MNKIIVSTAYFPPIQYISKFIMTNDITIEIHDNYTKQSFKNRCQIAGANGILNLSIPIIHNHKQKIKTKDILISYTENWQNNHFRSIESSYRSSPFYEYYIDEFSAIFQTKHKYLIDLNQQIMEHLAETISFKLNASFTEQFQQNTNDFLDYRESIHPKKSKIQFDRYFSLQPYHQVFIEKSGFFPNLSILDLLFNQGTSTIDILNNSILKN